MKHFIIEATYKVPLDRLNPTLQAHRDYLQKGYDKGWLLISGRKIQPSGGMIVARAPSLEDLQGFFKGDPFMQQDFVAYRFVEFEPIKRQAFLDSWVAGK